MDIPGTLVWQLVNNATGINYQLYAEALLGGESFYQLIAVNTVKNYYLPMGRSTNGRVLMDAARKMARVGE